MSRGPGKRQQLLLTRIRRLKPGRPEQGVGWFYLSDLVEEQFREESVVRPQTRRPILEESFRRAAQALADSGHLQVERAGRDLIVRPTPPPKPNTYEFADGATPNTYPK